MKLRERDEPLDPSAERELEAVERSLNGWSVDPDLEGWAELSALLADERPPVDQRWRAELDERAARHFRPEGDGDGGSGDGSLRAFADRLREFSPRRLAAPAGALATLAIVAAVAASTLGGGGSSGDSSSDSAARQTITSTTAAQSSAASGESAPTPRDAAGAVFDANAARRSDSSDSRLGYPGHALRLAPGTKRRQEDREVSLTLSSRPEDVANTSDQAIAITRGLDGIVTSSQVSTSGKRASATLALTIPSRNLDGALDRLTKIADVKSLQQSTVDITKPFVSARDRLADAEAERRSLLKALGNASTDEEAAALKLRIADARRAISRARSSFENVARRARFSQVSLAIEGDPRAAAGKSDEGRTLGTWFDDTLSVLRDVAGVLLITAAIVVPVGLLIALAWFGVATLRRRRREQALGL